ncbi:MAG: rhomboid family intramembrane serine protease [Planctomycetota bacterium]|nr:rhomboid family intramembrane serine protease [Planctomycetota bacterium]
MSGSSSISLPCPTCGARYRWTTPFAGRKIKCAKCDDVIRLPADASGQAVLVRKAANAPAASPPARAPAQPPPRPPKPPVADDDLPLLTEESVIEEPPATPSKSKPPPVPPARPASAGAEDDLPLLLDDPEAGEDSLEVIDDDPRPAVAPTSAKRALPPIPPVKKAEPPAMEELGGLDLFPQAPKEELIEYDIADEIEAAAPTKPVPVLAANAEQDPFAGLSQEGPANGPECPSCRKRLKLSAKICSACGILIASGRPLVTSQSGDLNLVYHNTEAVIRPLSFFIPFGFFPITSEALGSRRKYAITTITTLTILISSWFLFMELKPNSDMRSLKNLMMWAGEAKPDPRRLRMLYTYTTFGDTAALAKKIREVQEAHAAAKIAKSGASSAAAPPPGEAAKPAAPGKAEPADESDDDEGDEAGTPVAHGADVTTIQTASPDILLEAHEALHPNQRATGEFEFYQLFTHAFLHGGVMHLAGNLVFLLVFGSRINAYIGSLGTTAVYLFLAMAAGIAHLLASVGDQPTPLVGASGAIMGLAGMYFVLFPVQRVHSVIWLRLGLFTGFRLLFKIFECRGFWILLFYIFFDVLYTALGVKDGTAHWAHLGGFISGMALAIVLLATRGVNGHGCDLLSVVFGRWAWPLIGRPAQWTERGTEEGWLQRVKLPARAPKEKVAEKAEAPTKPR